MYRRNHTLTTWWSSIPNPITGAVSNQITTVQLITSNTGESNLIFIQVVSLICYIHGKCNFSHLATTFLWKYNDHFNAWVAYWSCTKIIALITKLQFSCFMFVNFGQLISDRKKYKKLTGAQGCGTIPCSRTDAVTN